MVSENPKQPGQTASIAHLYKLFDQEVRRKIMELLQTSGSLSFKDISRILDLDRAALAYHLKILKEAELVVNYYDNKKDTSSYSYYMLTEFARLLISNAFQLFKESSHYISSDLNQHEDGGFDDRKKELADEVFRIIKDPRVRFSNYRIYLKK